MNNWDLVLMYNDLFCLGWSRWGYWDHKEDGTYHHETHAVENLAEIGVFVR